MRLKNLFCILPMVALCLLWSCQERVVVDDRIDWESFMTQHDMLWDTLPTTFTDAPYMGNGMLGTMLYQSPNDNSIYLEICRSDVQNHRSNAYGETPYSRGRLPIGHFLLHPVGHIKHASMRLGLWDAQTTLELVTDKGTIKLTSYVHANDMLIVNEAECTGDESAFSWEWVAAEAISPRQEWGKRYHQPFRILPDYKENPPFVLTQKQDVALCVQPLYEGGETVTAWKEIEKDKHKVLLVNVSHSYPDTTARACAYRVLNDIEYADLAPLNTSHCSWWNKYYQASFVSIPDYQFESFYWIQMYKLAAATRSDRAYIDNHGPWLEETAWPYATWNLNVQLTYWPVNASNHLDLGESLLNALWNNRDHLRDNIPAPYRNDDTYGIGRVTGTACIGNVGIPGTGDAMSWMKDQANTPEIGLLTWTCHNLWLQYRYSMDEEMLRQKIFPLLRGAVNYYLNFLVEGDDGKFYLPATYSPEYGDPVENCNFDLALLKWGCETLISCTSILNINDTLLDRWKDVAARLVPFPEDVDEGFMIGQDQPYDKSHRHYSHLLMVYPLYLVNVEQTDGYERIKKSLDHWQSLKEYLVGYSCTGASSIAASLGHGDLALEYLKGLWGEFLRPNTFYFEDGPVIETPLSAAQSIHDMLLQSWGGIVRVFPAVPSEWGDVCFSDLRTEGAFLVSAKRDEGHLSFVRVKSLAGTPLVLDLEEDFKFDISGSRHFSCEKIQAHRYVLDLKKGEEIILYRSTLEECNINEVEKVKGVLNYYGSKAMKDTGKIKPLMQEL